MNTRESPVKKFDYRAFTREDLKMALGIGETSAYRLLRGLMAFGMVTARKRRGPKTGWTFVYRLQPQVLKLDPDVRLMRLLREMPQGSRLTHGVNLWEIETFDLKDSIIGPSPEAVLKGLEMARRRENGW